MKRHHQNAEEFLASRLAITTSEAAMLLGISSASVRTLVSKGRLKGVSFGQGIKSKSFIISVQSMREFLAGL